jgi:predicted aspartyl protease
VQLGRSAWVRTRPLASDPDDLRLVPEQHPMPQAFNVEVEGQLLVPARLSGPAGTVEGLALLDTGASRTLVELSAAEEIATLTQRGQRSASAYGGQVEFAGQLAVVRVVAAGADEQLRDVGVIDLADRARHAGVGLIAFIGLDVLTKGTLDVDLASGTARLEIGGAKRSSR